MKLAIVFALFCGAVFAQGLEMATPCNPAECVLPECRCSSHSFTDNIDIRNTPQLVTLTFDDAVTEIIYDMVMPVIDGRVNPDGCPAAVTFFVSHEYTDYSKVHAAWANGHEIALHSITHDSRTSYWATVDLDTVLAEFGGQIDMMAHFADIDIEHMKGIRVPLFQLSGNQTFDAVAQLGLTYDSSWPSQQTPGLWPYTLDHLSSQDCPIGACPTAALPGVWVNPLLNWRDSDNVICAMVDACGNVPSDDLDALVAWMIENFHRVYDTNRAPFGVYLHAAWFLKHDNHLPAYKLFLDYLDDLPDVYFVSSSRVIDYLRDPRAITDSSPTTTEDPTTTTEGSGEITTESFVRSPSTRNFQIFDECQPITGNTCVDRLCQLTKEATGEERWMRVCSECPEVYPWINNPLGVATVVEPED